MKILSLDMIHRAKSGHTGMPLGCAAFISCRGPAYLNGELCGPSSFAGDSEWVWSTTKCVPSGKKYNDPEFKFWSRWVMGILCRIGKEYESVSMLRFDCANLRLFFFEIFVYDTRQVFYLYRTIWFISA